VFRTDVGCGAARRKEVQAVYQHNVLSQKKRGSSTETASSRNDRVRLAWGQFAGKVNGTRGGKKKKQENIITFSNKTGKKKPT